MPIASIAGAALVLCAAALAATPDTGSFSGKTAQGKAISFTVRSSGTRIRALKVGYKAACPGGTAVATATLSGPFKISSGRFYAGATSGWVRGKFTTRHKASGTLRFRPTIYGMFGPMHCDTGVINWSARHN